MYTQTFKDRETVYNIPSIQEKKLIIKSDPPIDSGISTLRKNTNEIFPIRIIFPFLSNQEKSNRYPKF